MPQQSPELLGRTYLAGLLAEARQDAPDNLLKILTEGNEIARSDIHSRKGTIPYIPRQYASPDDTVSSKIGWEGTPPVGRILLDTRGYHIERFGFRHAYNEADVGFKLVDAVRERYLPAQLEKIRRDQDIDFIHPLLRGEGTSEPSSRDMLTMGASTAWDQTGSTPIEDIRQMRRRTDGTRLVLGYTPSLELMRHPSVTGYVGDDRTVLSLQHVADTIFALVPGIREIILVDEQFHKGARSKALNLENPIEDVVYLDNPSNLVRVPWKEADADDYTDKATKKVYVQTDEYLDVMVADPTKSIALTGAIAA